MPRTKQLILHRFEKDQDGGYYFEEGIEVVVLREEGDKVVIRGPAFLWSCNPGKLPEPVPSITMLVPKTMIEEDE